MKSSAIFSTLGICLYLITLSACVDTSGNAVSAVEDYIRALANKDTERLSMQSCADWEAQAKTELESFTAVTVRVENLSCLEAGTDGDFTQVTCMGKIIANYGNEDLEIDLSERTYQASFEAGEWRMCGYR